MQNRLLERVAVIDASCAPSSLPEIVNSNPAIIPSLVSTLLPPSRLPGPPEHHATPPVSAGIFSLDGGNHPTTISSTSEGIRNVGILPVRQMREEYATAGDWILWMALGGEPEASLQKLAEESGGSGVCGAVWGANDIAYRCRTCEYDPTCAICVPCFLAGDHEHHDYAMIKTGGGCCDCGDPTAWHRSGFCRRHAGPGQSAALPPDLEARTRAVLAAVVHEWSQRLRTAAVVQKAHEETENPASLLRLARRGRVTASQAESAKSHAATATRVFSAMMLRLATASEGLTRLVAACLCEELPLPPPADTGIAGAAAAAASDTVAAAVTAAGGGAGHAQVREFDTRTLVRLHAMAPAPESTRTLDHLP